MDTAYQKEFKKAASQEFARYIIGAIITGLLIAMGFYFNTKSILSAHETQLNQLQVKIENKADASTVEKRLDRIENKIDNLIELQINNQ